MIATPTPRTTPQEMTTFVERLQTAARGRAQALTARQLRDRWGYSDRALRALVHAANEAGHLIVACDCGYYVPIARGELDEPVRRLRSQALEMMARARQIEELGRLAFEVPCTGRLF